MDKATVSDGATRVESRQREPKIKQIYWVDENEKSRLLSELYEGVEITLCISVGFGYVGKTINLKVIADKGKKFVGGETELKYDNLIVEKDNKAYIKNFKIEYEK